ncbi:protocatechuate 3,4-dioxygenase subunit alpha [Microbispora sp. CA-102843]|uniref:dioxygenase family protein n=1 Tax=Microbispora sp. CA-102843 TaxID=3239952 RepID=UPI003D8E37EA
MTTPSQTVGPFFGFALPYPGDWELVPEGHPGALTIAGRVLDGAGEPVPDALLEIWTGDSGTREALRRTEAGDSGFGRCGTAPDGSYRFRLAPPARPYVALLIFARGLLKPVRTRVYLADAPDPLLDSLDPARRATLLVRPQGQDVYRFDVRLQGEQETVFLEF